ncbi:stonustoxin subunit beta [Salmo trutta]|uniref:stonustoxin subunit beta n=1 Tax=Salmo trutta TaxID=8032 RepID=UPI001132398F|nr:stonustoxin subunit beta-like [Salmo trutta]
MNKFNLVMEAEYVTLIKDLFRTVTFLSVFHTHKRKNMESLEEDREGERLHNSVDHGAECGLQSTLKKYACELTLDPNTAHRKLILFEGNRKVRRAEEEQLYFDHPERFEKWSQVLCREGLTGRCYWEVEWTGQEIRIGVTYKGICRRGLGYECGIGHNDMSWSLSCYDDYFNARHNKENITVPAPSSRSHRVGVFLDWPAGTLSFYSVSSDTLTHLHTFHNKFTEPLYPGFRMWYRGSSVSLCKTTAGEG